MQRNNIHSIVPTNAVMRLLAGALLLLGFSIKPINGQVASTFTFTNTSSTFTPITGGTVVSTGADDVQFPGLPIGFTFTYNGNTYTSFTASSNGYMQFGANTASGYVPLASFGNVISGMGGDLLGLATNASEMRYQTTGASPNRVLTMQWANWGFNNAGATSADFDFQIKLSESSNNIQIIYQPLLANTETTVTTPAGVVQVGLTGNTSADFNSRTTTTNWATNLPAGSVAPGVAEMTYNQTVRPVAGTVFNFTPAASCVTPPAPPTSIGFTGIGDTYATVNYTSASGADRYLIVRYPTGATPTAPTDGNAYSPGDPLGTGVVAGNTVGNSFGLTTLTPATAYDIYVYSTNALCAGGPLYLTIPLTGTFTTLPPSLFTTWNGSVSTDWNTAANWTPNTVPNQTISVVIPASTPFSPVVTTNVACDSISLQNGATVQINALSKLDIYGNLTGVNGGTFIGLGKITLTGSALQTVKGNIKAGNVDFSNTSAPGVVVAAGADFRIEPTATNGTGIVTFGNSAKFTNNGKFTLVSNAIATAKIGPIPTVAPNAASITGNMTVERYLPNLASGNGSWYFMGSPVAGQDFNDFADDFGVTGLTGGFGDQGGNIISSIEPERSTIFKYMEASHNVHLDTVQKNGWRIPGNENVISGNGYRVWVKYQSNSSHKFDNTGPISIGNSIDGSYSLPTLTRNEYAPCYPTTPGYNPEECNESNRGWNLLSNPFPCDIDWDVPGWVKPNSIDMNDAFITWHSQLQGYRVYVGSTGVSLGVTPSALPDPNLIASGQGFFVRKLTLSKAGAIAVKESGKKTSTSAVFTRPSVEAVNEMRIGLTHVGDNDGYQFLCMLKMRDDASDSFDPDYEAYGMAGNRPSIGFPMDNELMVLNTIGPVTETKTVPVLFLNGGQDGTYKFRFTDVESFSDVTIFLKDNYLGTVTEVAQGQYTFHVDGNAPSYATDRFEIILNPNSFITLTPTSGNSSGLSVYPNPALSGKGTTFGVSGFDSECAVLTIRDFLGKVIYKKTVTLNGKGVTEFTMTEKIPAGVYIVNTTGGSKSLTRKMVVR